VHALAHASPALPALCRKPRTPFTLVGSHRLLACFIVSGANDTVKTSMQVGMEISLGIDASCYLFNRVPIGLPSPPSLSIGECV
jgi:hypothetical protein